MLKMKLLTTMFLCFGLITGSNYLTKARVSGADEPVRYFPETDHSIRGRFLEYWETNGGLRQQGYPISDQLQETSSINGKTYIVQYFERAVFEWHPENKPPYDVLLTLLGRMRYEEKYPGGAPNQKPNDSPNSVLIPQTGKRIGGSFLEYWKAFGGVMQQGYPISDEIQEVSELDGNVYTMQYFERAVMEWHPGNTPPNDILLSHLGRIRYNTLYGSTNPTPANRHALVTEIESRPLAIEHRLFYVKTGDMNFSIYSYDLHTYQESLLVTSPGTVSSLAADKSILAWVQDLSSIHTYDTSSGEEHTILQVSSPRFPRIGALAVDSGLLYYQDTAPDHTGLYMHDLATHEESLVSRDGEGPVARDGILLWSEAKNKIAFSDYSLHMKKGGENITIVGNEWAGFSSYYLTSEYAAWATAPGAQDRSVYLFDIDAKTVKRIAGGASYVYIAENLVATEVGVGTYTIHNSPPGGTITVYDIETAASRTLVKDTEGPGPKVSGIIDNKWLAYTHSDGETSVLYVTPLFP